MQEIEKEIEDFYKTFKLIQDKLERQLPALESDAVAKYTLQIMEKHIKSTATLDNLVNILIHEKKSKK